MAKSKRGADKILASITHRLSIGELKPGERLPAEAKLCEEFQVSRTVVREAIQQLKAIGAVNTITGSGSYLTDGDLGGFKKSLEFYSIMSGDTNSWIELLELRILLESSCARKVASTHFSAKGVKAINSALNKMNEHRDDHQLFAQLDVKFHETIISESGNSIYIAVLSSLHNLQLRFSKETYSKGNSQLLIDRNHKEHCDIVAAIEARDPDLAEKAMVTHLNATMNNLLEFIKGRDSSNFS